MSPNYPYYYPGNLTCQWVIRVPQGYRIHLVFSRVMLQKTDMCKSDYILVMDGAGASVHIMKRLCVHIGYIHFYSSGNCMTVRFVSDRVFINKGFYASYNAMIRATSPTPMMSSTAMLSGSTPSLTPRQTLVVSPSKTTNVVPKQTPSFLPGDYISVKCTLALFYSTYLLEIR